MNKKIGAVRILRFLRGDRMTWLRVVIDGKLVLLNADKVSAIASDYIQFDNGSRAFADVDMDSALLEIRRMYEEKKKCTTHT